MPTHPFPLNAMKNAAMAFQISLPCCCPSPGFASADKHAVPPAGSAEQQAPAAAHAT
ncbi:MAG: hypothetical protein GY738_16035, partial [Pseudoalteromonas sp.]|nr:hypothetical protein [Pseudoalteromonas sp.]